jgi:peptide/nickel transport system permease protein
MSVPAPARFGLRGGGELRARQLPRRLAQSSLLRVVGRRLLAIIPVIWGVTFLTFLVMNLVPGNVARSLLGATATPAQVNAYEAQLGLNHPFLVLYGNWLGNIVQGNLGNSYVSHQPVTSTIGSELPVSFELIAYAFLLALLIAIPLALMSARRPNGTGDRVTMVFSMAGVSIANYVLAVVLVWLFADVVHVFPAIGFVPIGTNFVENLRSLTLPAIAVALPLAFFYTRLLRADLLEQMQREDYVVTAKAKGLGPWRVIMRHALRNSLFGLITVIALNFGTLLGAVVIIEQIFSLPGLGNGLIQAIGDHDTPVIEATVLIFALMTVAGSLLADVFYAVLDPRIRYGGTAE